MTNEKFERHLSDVHNQFAPNRTWAMNFAIENEMKFGCPDCTDYVEGRVEKID
jgi:hypothetical protein